MSATTEAELAEQVAQADGPLWIRGGNTRGVSCDGVGLEVSGLKGVELYDPGALTMVAWAGTSLAEIKSVLSGEGQQLAFEPMDHRGLSGALGEPTIGGMVAANISGPRRVQVGACRDHLLGLRYVDGMGQVIRNGGRVMKNVTGYDLVRLMAGSWGTLGVITQVALKVLPSAETEASVLIHGLNTAQALRVMATALRSPYEVSGAAFGHVAERHAVVLRIEGFGGSVAYRCARLREMLAGSGAIEVCDDAAKSAGVWQDLRDVAFFHHAPGDVWCLSVRAGQAGDLAARLDARDLLLDWGGARIWALAEPGCDLRARAGAFDGHATLVRADSETKARLGRFHPRPAPLAAIEARLRARFDPRGIFNPGLMG